MTKSHPHLLQSTDTIFVVVDVQQSLMRSVCEAERLNDNIRILLRGMHVLRVPVVATTQNAAKLGDVVPEIKSLLPTLLPPFDKMGFSCCSSPGFDSEIRRSGRKQVLICGVEAHICVSQTAHDLAAEGLQVHVVADAVSSRTELNCRIGLDKMRQAGILLSSTEMALFELLHEAGTPEFRDILKLVK